MCYLASYSSQPVWWHIMGIAIPDVIRYPDAGIMLIDGREQPTWRSVRIFHCVATGFVLIAFRRRNISRELYTIRLKLH